MTRIKQKTIVCEYCKKIFVHRQNKYRHRMQKRCIEMKRLQAIEDISQPSKKAKSSESLILWSGDGADKQPDQPTM